MFHPKGQVNYTFFKDTIYQVENVHINSYPLIDYFNDKLMLNFVKCISWDYNIVFISSLCFELHWLIQMLNNLKLTEQTPPYHRIVSAFPCTALHILNTTLLKKYINIYIYLYLLIFCGSFCIYVHESYSAVLL